PIISRALPTSVGVAQSPFNVLGLAETLIHAHGSLDSSVTKLVEGAVLSVPPFGTSSPSAPCYQRVGCYDNLKLVNATAVLAVLAALPGRHGSGQSTFANPRVAAQAALGLLRTTIPRVEIPTARLEVTGVRLTGAVLSDPANNPPAYLALSAMKLGRALQL